MHLEINLTPQAFSYATLGSNGMIYIPPFGLNESIDYMLKMDPTTYDITKISSNSIYSKNIEKLFKKIFENEQVGNKK